MAVNTKEKDSKKKIVVATLEAFWLDPYWAQFNLSDLNLIYEFSLTTPEYCEGELKTIEKAGLPEHTCRASLKIEMNGTDDTLVPDSVRDDPSNEKISNEEEYDDGLGPEVQFDKDVFADAKNVRMFYTVKVHSPRQLNLANNENLFEDVDTVLTSQTLNFSLKEEDELDDEHDHKNDDDPDSYEYPEPATSSSEGHKKVSNVNTEDKASADQHAGHEKSKEHGKGVASDGKQHEPEDSKNKEEDKEENDSTEKSQEETKDDENEEKSKENEDDHEEETKQDNIVETQEKSDSEENLETSLLESNETEGNSTEVHTSSFFDEYLNNAGQWPLLKIGLIVTILSCTLLFLLGCCCYHKDCCCYSDRKKVTSKSANGYQYHMTNGNGQEMVGITQPEQEKLNQ